MVKRNLIFIAAIMMFGMPQAQVGVDSLLLSVSMNNKSLRSESSRIQAAKTQFKIGNTLPDPVVDYDYFKGYPSTAGNQTDFSIVQGFDFPTSYKNRRTVMSSRTNQIDYEGQLLRQEILLEAKLTALDLIYLNKRIAELNTRLQNAESFYTDYQKKFEKQDVTILDINKAKLQLVNIQIDKKLAESQRHDYMQKLTELNGGVPVILTDTVYPIVPETLSFEVLYDTIEAVNPERKFFEARIQTGEAEIKLTKSLILPKFEVGYHYQGILRQRFHGAHIGFTIPLWENRYKVRYQELQTQFYNAQLEENHTIHFYELRQLYDKAVNLDSSLNEYRSNLYQLNSTDLLRKSLQAGQMTTLQYYLEVTLLYDSRDKFLELEREYHKTIVRLYKHSL